MVANGGKKVVEEGVLVCVHARYDAGQVAEDTLVEAQGLLHCLVAVGYYSP